MFFGSTTQDSVDTKLVSFTKYPVELMIEHQGDSVSMREQESSSGFCDER